MTKKAQNRAAAIDFVRPMGYTVLGLHPIQTIGGHKYVSFRY